MKRKHTKVGLEMLVSPQNKFRYATCTACRKVLYDERSLNQAARCHHNRERFICSACQQRQADIIARQEQHKMDLITAELMALWVK